MSSRPGHDSRRCGLAPTGAGSKSATGASPITAGTRLRGSESSILRRKVANIVGSASGSFIVGFILMDAWSVRQISVCLLLVALIPGAFLLFHAGRIARIVGSFGCCIAVLIALLSPLLFSNLYLNLL